MAKQQTEKCQGHDHPVPTPAEQDQMSAAMVEAAQAIDKAWGYANRTPSYHWLTDKLGPVMADLVRWQRIV